MSSSLSGRVARALRVLVVVFAVGWGVVGCAGSGERLPTCKGRPVPINPLSPRVVSSTVATSPTVPDGPVTQVPLSARGGGDAH